MSGVCSIHQGYTEPGCVQCGALNERLRDYRERFIFQGGSAFARSLAETIDRANEWDRLFGAWVKHQAGLDSLIPLWPNPNWSQDVAMVAHALIPHRALPDVLFDGWAVYCALPEEDRRRISHEDVTDVLRTIIRLVRADRPVSGRERLYPHAASSATAPPAAAPPVAPDTSAANPPALADTNRDP